MKERLNSTLDDVCSVIGYTATRKLQAWFHSRNLYIPDSTNERHPLNILIGRPAFVSLVREFGGTTLWVPSAAEDLRYFTQREMAHQIASGMEDDKIASFHKLSVSRVRYLRAELVTCGWVAYATDAPAVRPMAGRNRGLEERARKNLEPGGFLENAPTSTPAVPGKVVSKIERRKR